MNYKKITLSNTNARNISFNGILLGCTRESEKNGRWKEYAIYRLYKGQFVVELIECSKFVGEEDLHLARLCKNESEIFDTLGFQNTVKDLYDKVGIRHDIYVEGDLMPESQYNKDKQLLSSGTQELA